MKTKNTLSPAETNVVVAEWQRPKGERATQTELAFRFNVAPVTVRRALAEHGLVELVGYKTQADTAILDFLKSQGLNDIKKLSAFVVKARQAKSVK